MEFRETLLAAQRNQQHKSSGSSYYKAGFDPPKKEKELKPKDRLSANIQKFLAKKEEEEKQKQLEVKRKRDELLAMRDPKAIRKIQKTLKVIKSANKSVLADAIDTENTAVTLEGPQQPDQDDYGYESQEAAAIYQKMMEKYSKLPEEPKFPLHNVNVKRDINGTRERVRHALQHVDDPVPHKRRRRTNNDEDREPSPLPKADSDKKKEEKIKIRKSMPPPMDFNQLLKLAEQKKCEPIEVAAPKKVLSEGEMERPMTKKQKREYEEELARKLRRQQEIERAAGRKVTTSKDEKLIQHSDKKSETFNRIPKLSHQNAHKNGKPIENQLDIKYRQKSERERSESDKYKSNKIQHEKVEKEKSAVDKDKLYGKERILNKDKISKERMGAIKSKCEINHTLHRPLEINKNINLNHRMLNKNKEKINSSKESVKQDIKKNIDLKIQNTFRIDKSTSHKKFVIPNKNSVPKHLNGHSSQNKVLKQSQETNDGKEKVIMTKQKILFGSNNTERPNGKTENGKHTRLEQNKQIEVKSKTGDRKSLPNGNKQPQPSSSKPRISNSFDFDKHVNSLSKAVARKSDGIRQFPPDIKRKGVDDAKRKIMQKRRVLDSEDDYDSEMDDFIDDGEEETDYSTHIKEIFGYDKQKYRHMDDDDDPEMESSFVRQMREEYVSKKIGIMEDLEDMRMEAMEKKIKAKKKRRIDD